MTTFAYQQTVLDVFQRFTVDVAVTGASGTGKSSLVNGLLGMGQEGEGAPTGVVETTMEPTAYPHPTLPHVRVWDLPGVGTPCFRSRDYVKAVNFDHYDMFIVVDCVRVKEHSLYLVEEILRRSRPFFFVRSKVDHDVAAESKKGGSVEGVVLEKMRSDCIRHLRTKVLEPRVFLVSTQVTDKYDLRLLVHTLEAELPRIRKHSFGLFVQSISQQKTMLWSAVPPAVKWKKISLEDLQNMKAVMKCWNLSKRLMKPYIMALIDEEH